MTQIDKVTVSYHGNIVGTLSLSADNNLCSFEYDRHWLAEGFSISPFQLPLKGGIFIAKPTPFAGNFGIFEDSMPDGYGRYLLHKALARNGINDYNLNALERLTLVGNGSMGALEYEPARQISNEFENDDFDALQSKALEVLGELQDKDAAMLLYNSGNSGGARPKAIFSDDTGHWLIKFRHTYDPLDMGKQEFRYNEYAKECEINVPEFKLTNGKYFTSRRFDISPEGERIHTATVGALLGLSLNEPYLDYRNLLALTGFLTQSRHEVEQMYRRMVFNYLIGNKDDHCKNFSFITVKDNRGKWRWQLAPAYDLTLCTEGYNGQHATSVNGRANPSLNDFVDLGIAVKISEERCLEIIRQMQEICRDIACYKIL